jgi:hypothetical protein
MRRHCILNENIYRRNFSVKEKCDAAHDIEFFLGQSSRHSLLISIRRLLWLLPPILGQTDSTRDKNGNGGKYSG